MKATVGMPGCKAKDASLEQMSNDKEDDAFIFVSNLMEYKERRRLPFS